MQRSFSGPLSDADAAWELLGDTDWMNRVAGSPPVGPMQMVVSEAGIPTVHGRIAGPLGGALDYTEHLNAWVYGRFFIQGRRFSSGPMLETRYEARLEPSGAGVIPTLTLTVTPRSALLSPIVAAILRQREASWAAALAELPPPGGSAGTPELRELPPVAEHAMQRWRAHVPAELGRQVERLLRTARPVALQKIRAFRLADTWGLDREEVLLGLLRGVADGLLELYWSVRCPRCQGQTASTGLLGDVVDHASCSSCRIDFSADLGDSVEVLFAPHASVIPRVQENFCSVFPAGAPEIRASLLLPPAESIDVPLKLTPGRWRMGQGGTLEDAVLDVREDGEATIKWTPNTVGEFAIRPGGAQLQAHNNSAHPIRVQVLRTADEIDDLVPATYLMNLEEFRRSMSHQVLSADTRITARSICLMFTDLTDSTAMYEELGDAAAYSLVRDHFAVLRRVVESHGGAVIKTIGDAIMASFNHPERAMAAAVQMHADIDAFTLRRPDLTTRPRLKIGLHQGPALAVHSDGSGLDYFGRTCNIAARTQGSASGGQICWTDSINDIDAVQVVVHQTGVDVQDSDESFRGIDSTTRVYRVALAQD